MTTDKDPATILEEAADLLLIHGRCREALIEDDGSMCAVGALRAAGLGGADAFHPASSEAALDAYSEAVMALSKRVELTTPHGTVVGWNNDLATTDDDVRDAMLLAAKALRNEAVSP